MTPVAWLAAALVLVLAEIVTVNFVFASFALAAVAAAAAALLPFGVAGEIAVFAAVSVVSLALIRPAVLQRLYRRGDTSPIGTDRWIGRTVYTTTDVSQTGGSIVMDGETWSARCVSGVIAAGTPVTVTDIAGAIANVRPA